jgi:1-phosphofructokinase
MIVTLTLNPSLDLTYHLGESSVGDVDVHRAASATLEASGKGVNVSRALHANGVDTIAVLPLGGSTGHHLSELLRDEGVAHRSVSQATATRINTTIALAQGETAKVNGPGGLLRAEDVDHLKSEVEAALHAVPGSGEVWLAICGSLPPGVEPTVIGDFVELAHANKSRCAVDASGDALSAAISAGADLLAPNRIELAEVDPHARTADSVRELGQVAAHLARTTRAELLVSLGRDGALYTDGDLVLHGHGPTLTPVNTAGAGDALLSGWLAGGATAPERLARAISWGRAACLSPMTVAPAPSEPEASWAAIAVDDISKNNPERSQP